MYQNSIMSKFSFTLISPYPRSFSFIYECITVSPTLSVEKCYSLRKFIFL